MITQAPYSREGNLLHWPGLVSQEERNGVTWEPNDPFPATLTLLRHQRARSAAYFIWSDPLGREFPMFMVDIVQVIQSGIIDRGTITAQWDVAKRGDSYGIKLATASTKETS